MTDSQSNDGAYLCLFDATAENADFLDFVVRIRKCAERVAPTGNFCGAAEGFPPLG